MTKAYKCLCKNCGSVNMVTSSGVKTDDNWLPCVLPTGFEWNLPSGKICPVVGDPIYLDAGGNRFSYVDYLSKFSIDPEIAYIRMRANRCGDKV